MMMMMFVLNAAGTCASTSHLFHMPSHLLPTTRLRASARLDGPLSIDAVEEVLPQSFYETLQADDIVPWDLVGRPQPCVYHAGLERAFGPEGTTILDCGCGTGDNANFLASQCGYDVLGFDISSSAVDAARERVGWRVCGVALTCTVSEFCVASAIDLGSAVRVQQRAEELGGFEAALDSALLHCLDDAAQRRYVNDLHALIRPGGSLFVGCFSDAIPDPWRAPRRMSERQLHALLAPQRGWHVKELREVWYQRPSQATSGGSGGSWVMAWWCHVIRQPQPTADAIAVSDPEPCPTISSSHASGALFPKKQWRVKMDGWRAVAVCKLAAAMTRTTSSRAGESAADGGELTLLLSWSQGDPSWAANSIRRRLSRRWRLSCAWRASGDQRGVCFGLGSGKLWGEEFFLLDREP